MRKFQTIGTQIYKNKWISIPIKGNHKAFLRLANGGIKI